MRAFQIKFLLPAVAVIGLFAGVPAHAETKIGVLDFGRLLEESPQGKVLLESLGNEAAAKRRDLQGAATALQTKRDKLAKDRATMSPDQITRAERELRDGERDLARRQAEAQDQLNDRRNEEMGKLQRDLITEVRAFAKAQNYDVVITEGVIYATQAMDMTPALLQSLQSRPAAAKPAGR
ncbi:MAG: OmpH family outer membrane protein [Proteobacteria bacterium]|jgi:outer membrane protein|nr:OmpH family outer membrane protein [Pseudomonadota bacterium]